MSAVVTIHLHELLKFTWVFLVTFEPNELAVDPELVSDDTASTGKLLVEFRSTVHFLHKWYWFSSRAPLTQSSHGRDVVFTIQNASTKALSERCCTDWALCNQLLWLLYKMPKPWSETYMQGPTLSLRQ